MTAKKSISDMLHVPFSSNKEIFMMDLKSDSKNGFNLNILVMSTCNKIIVI